MIGSEVKVELSDAEIFHGTITSHVVEIDENGERLVAEAEHHLAKQLGTKITNRYVLNGQTATKIENGQLQFNISDDSFASDTTVLINGRDILVFDPNNPIRRWTVADTLKYLIATEIPTNLETPSSTEIDDLTGQIDLGQLDLNNVPLGKALTQVAARGGCVLRAARDGSGITLNRQGQTGRRVNVSLQPAGSDFSLDETNLWKGKIKFNRRPSRKTVLALAGPKLYESTFELSKGWDTSLETIRWRDFVRSESQDWNKTANVFRKWGLNEHGGYSKGPYYIPLHSFSNISSEDFRLKKPRSFLPCLSKDKSGQSLGVVIEVRYDPEQEWQRWPHPVWVSQEDCSIYFSSDSLPSDFFQAAIYNTLSVRVTGAVESDVNLSCEVEGDSGCVTEVLDLSDRFAWRKVHSTSIYYEAGNLGTPYQQDDTESLENVAKRYAEIASKATQAELSLAWLDISYRIGDLVERIDGRTLELSSNPGTKPFVQSILHDLEAQSTKLIVSG